MIDIDFYHHLLHRIMFEYLWYCDLPIHQESMFIVYKTVRDIEKNAAKV